MLNTCGKNATNLNAVGDNGSDLSNGHPIYTRSNSNGRLVVVSLRIIGLGVSIIVRKVNYHSFVSNPFSDAPLWVANRRFLSQPTRSLTSGPLINPPQLTVSYGSINPTIALCITPKSSSIDSNATEFRRVKWMYQSLKFFLKYIYIYTKTKPVTLMLVQKVFNWRNVWSQWRAKWNWGFLPILLHKLTGGPAISPGKLIMWHMYLASFSSCRTHFLC